MLLNIKTKTSKVRNILKKPVVFQKLTGLSPDKFWQLHFQIKEEYEKAELSRLDEIRKGKARERKTSIGGRFRISFEDRLFMTLIRLRHNTKYCVLSLMFNMTEGNCHKVINPIIDAISKVATLEMASHTMSEDEIFEIVDGTEQRTERRKEVGYSGKKKAHTIKTQVVTGKYGYIVHVSESVPGNIHDKKLFDMVGRKPPKGGFLIGDLGYLGAKDVLIPLKSSKHRKLNEKQKEYNHIFSKKRIVVEHTFARIKKFRRLDEKWIGKTTRYNIEFRAICGLSNLMFKS